MKNILVAFAFLCTLVVISSMNISCADSPKATDTPQATETPIRESSMDAAASNPAPAAFSGKVVETMNSGGYTYVNIDQNGKTIWIAAPMMQMTVGQEVSFRPGSVMNNFSSNSLGRNFERIVFSPGLVVAAVSETKGPLLDTKPSESMHGVVPVVAETEKIKVEKADGANAYTVAELHAKRGELDTKSVVLKGKVVKVSMGIMGKNWIHIQDGSGSAPDGTNNMIVTSQDAPAVGDVVTANGTLHKDKDFGMGYFYAVIVEEGSIK